MKKAFSTLACPDLCFAELTALAQRTGMNAVEIRLDKENRICGWGIEHADEILRISRETGIAISDLGTGIFVREWDENTVESMVACGSFAALVGARAIRVFADAKKAEDGSHVLDFDGVARTLREGAKRLAPLGVEVWIENHSAYSTGASIAPLLKEAECSNLRVIWDILHSIEFGEEPSQTVRLIGNAIAHVHLKDGSPDQDGKPYTLTRMDEGAVDFREIAKALKSIGYAGYLSLEWELMWHPELARYFSTTEDLLLDYNDCLSKYFLR